MGATPVRRHTRPKKNNNTPKKSCARNSPLTPSNRHSLYPYSTLIRHYRRVLTPFASLRLLEFCQKEKLAKVHHIGIRFQYHCEPPAPPHHQSSHLFPSIIYPYREYFSTVIKRASFFANKDMRYLCWGNKRNIVCASAWEFKKYSCWGFSIWIEMIYHIRFWISNL